MRSQTTCPCTLVATFGALLAGCGSSGAASGSGGAAGQSATGGTGSGGVVETGGSTTSPAGGATGSGGSGSGGDIGASGDASVVPSGDGSVGCGVSGAPTGALTAQSITVADNPRTYVLSVPRNYTPDTPWPLIFAWHGMGGSGSVARSYFHLESTSASASPSPFIIVYPDGLPVGDGGTGWDTSATGIDVALFDALLGYVSENYCIDRNRIFSTGHSFGAMFTNDLGCYRGDVLRAIAPVAGMPPFGRNVTCAGNVAAWIIHGENDPSVDYTTGGIASRDFWIGRNGCSTDAVATSPAGCVEYQDCQPDLPVGWCVHTEGHNWPTANATGCSDGGVCFDAGPSIMAFFARFK
jgi:polyhydroxybutyrate depolymerase